MSFSAEQMEILDVSTAVNGALPPVIVNIREDRITADVTAELKRILQAHPGKAPVHMSVTRPGRAGPAPANLASFSVEPGSSFMADVNRPRRSPVTQ